MKPVITHLILGGGGFKGLYYLGIMRYLYLEKLIDNIKYIAGTSIGAYFGILLAMRICIEDIENILYDVVKNIDNFNLKLSKNNIEKIMNMKGIYDINEVLIKPLRKIINDKYGVADITFIEFIKKTGINIFIDSMCISDGKSVIFSADTTPNISILDAVAAAMSVSFLFKPVMIDNKYYVDNVISDNISISNIFCDILPDYKLFIYISQADGEKMSIIQRGEKMSFFCFVKRVIAFIFKSIIIDETICDNMEVLKFVDIPYHGAFDIVIINNEIRTQIDIEDMNTMILRGFIDITYYMNNRMNRYKNNLEDSN